MLVVDVTHEQFDEVINKNELVLVDFWSTYCAPCKAQSAALDDLADEVSEGVVIAKVNASDNLDLVHRYGIRGVPTLLLFKNGEVIDRRAGYTSKDDLLKMIKAAH